MPLTDSIDTWPILVGLLVAVCAALGYRLYLSRRKLRMAIDAHELRVKDARRRQEQALAAIEDAVFIVDSQERIVSANPAAETLLGAEQQTLSGEPLFEILPLKRGAHPGDAADPLTILRRRFRRDHRAAAVDHVSIRRADGKERSAHVTMVKLRDSGELASGAVLVVHDTTDQHEAEEEKAKAERLESIGLLAGGLAHDFNNLLAIIIGNLSLLSGSLDADDEEARREAEQAALRAKGLTQQLLTFARGGAPVLRSMHIEPLLREAASLVFSGRRIVAEIEAADDLPPVAIDAGQIYQVLTNLLINAAEAQDGIGTIHLSARPARHKGRPQLEIRIRDEGPGIDAELQRKIFDAYFTTKADGSGLGLPTSFSIVHRHGGQLLLEETGEDGSTFLVRLPLADDQPQSQRAIHSGLIGEGARVLLMDDDRAVRRVATRMLERRGVEVQSATNGEDAVALWFAAEKRKKHFTLGIFDLTVPTEIGGLEAAQQIRERDPGARLIVCSGYANDPIMAEYAEHGFVAVLRKPFQDADLVQTINEAMEADPSRMPRSGEGTL